MRLAFRNFPSKGRILLLATLLLVVMQPTVSYSQKKEKVVYDETFPESNGMVKVKKGKYFGFLNSKGKLIIETQYEVASDFDENGFSIVKGSIEYSFYELINKEGVKVYSGVVRELKYYPQWKRYLARENVFGHVILDEKGKRVPTESYAEFSDINSNGIGIIKMLEKADSYGIFSMKTGMITKTEFKKIYSESNGFRTYEKMSNGVMTCGYIDANGNLCKEVYEDAFDYSNDGVASVKRNGLIGFVDKNEKMITDFVFDKTGGFKEGSAIVIKNGNPGKVNLKGEYAATTVKWDEMGEDSEGYRWVKLFGLIGFIDKSDALVVPLMYKGCYSFKNGIAGVNKNGKFGFVNAQNKEVIPVKFDYVGRINDGMVLVKKDNLFGYYNDKGVEVAKVEFSTAEDFSGGFGKVTLGEKIGKVDKLGKIFWEKETVYTLVDDKAQWANDEKLKNVVDAKSIAKLPAGSAYGLQISKNVVSNRLLSYRMSGIGYKNGNYYGPGYKGGGYSRMLINQDVNDQDKGGLIVDLEIDFADIKEDKSGKVIGIGEEKIQEFDILESSIKPGNYVQVDLDLMEVSVSTTDIVAVLAKGEIDAPSPFYSPKDLYLILWDRKNKLVSTFLIHDGAINYYPKIAPTNDGNFVIGFDARPTSSIYRTTFEKIDVNTSLKTGKLKSVWKRTFSAADNFELTDMIVDAEGNIVSVYKTSEMDGFFSDKDKTKFGYAELGIVKCNSKGEEFRSNVIKSMTPDLWGRSSDGGKLEMRSQEKIYFSSNENPKIIENPNGAGYIVCSRLAYGLWVWSAEYQKMSDKYKAMYADQPAFAFIDENSMNITSFDFIETTASSNGHNFASYSLTSQLGKSWDIDEFQFNREKNEFVIVENFQGDYYKSQIWSFSIKLLKDWSGESGGTEVASTPTTTNTTKTNTTTNTTTKTTESCFILNDLTQAQMGGKNSIKLGFMGFRLATNYIARGKTMEVDCDDVLVYKLKNENSTERLKENDLFNTKGKCGQTIKLSEFW